MRPTLGKLVSLALLASSSLLAAPPQKLSKTDFTSWPRANAKEFGCFLEKSFGQKDEKFNCELKSYKNSGDPCKNTKEYYEGPTFPREKVGKVNRRIEDIQLSWEHGELQSVSVVMKKKYPAKELKNIFKLPEAASIQDCSLKATCIVLTGFDHMGAGDANCSVNQ